VEQRANAAEQKANIVEQRANVAEQKANVVEQRANAAEQKANVAEQRVNVAEQKVKVAEQNPKSLQHWCEYAAHKPKTVATKRPATHRFPRVEKFFFQKKGTSGHLRHNTYRRPYERGRHRESPSTYSPFFLTF
jgi:hypothetical protein